MFKIFLIMSIEKIDEGERGIFIPVQNFVTVFILINSLIMTDIGICCSL